MLFRSEQVIIDQILSNLQEIFAGSGVVFTTVRPAEGIEYSTIYIGGDDSAFAVYGSFLGLAEQVDIANKDPGDEGLVFSDQVARTSPRNCADSLAEVVAHETGHLLGYTHDSNISTGGRSGPLGDAALLVNPFEVIEFAGKAGSAVKKFMEWAGAGLAKGATVTFDRMESLLKPHCGSIDLTGPLAEVCFSFGAYAGFAVSGAVVSVSVAELQVGFSFVYDGIGKYWTISKGFLLDFAQKYKIGAEEFVSFKDSEVIAGVRFSAAKEVPLIPVSFGGKVIVDIDVDPDISVGTHWILSIQESFSYEAFMKAVGQPTLEKAVLDVFTPYGELRLSRSQLEVR